MIGEGDQESIKKAANGSLLFLMVRPAAHVSNR